MHLRRRGFVFTALRLLAIGLLAPLFVFILVRSTKFTYVGSKLRLMDLPKKAYHYLIAPDMNPVVDIPDDTGPASSLDFFHSPQYEISPTVTCHDKVSLPRIELRGEQYWVMYNYIKASKIFHCNETITLTTHGDHNFMENLGVMTLCCIDVKYIL
jgi:hypothetical protein